jgi:hypothetical protein
MKLFQNQEQQVAKLFPIELLLAKILQHLINIFKRLELNQLKLR